MIFDRGSLVRCTSQRIDATSCFLNCMVQLLYVIEPSLCFPGYRFTAVAYFLLNFSAYLFNFPSIRSYLYYLLGPFSIKGLVQGKGIKYATNCQARMLIYVKISQENFIQFNAESILCQIITQYVYASIQQYFPSLRVLLILAIITLFKIKLDNLYNFIRICNFGQMGQRKELQAYPETNLSNELLLHQREMLQFLFYTNYDIIYETFQLKHGSYSQRNRGQMVTSFKSQQIGKNYQAITQKLHLRILRDDIDLDKQLTKLELIWHNRNIPFFHRYYFQKYLFTAYLQNIGPAIAKEQQLIKKQEHIYFFLFKSINARQACLRNLKKHLAQLKPEDIYQYLHIAKERLFNERRKNQREKYRAQGYKLKLSQQTSQGKMSKTKFQLFSDCFNHLSKLTLYVIEQILKWKQYIASLTHDIRKQKQRMEYYFYDDNYFLKILTDLGFLKVSFLNQFYTFAPKNDPFLLQCVLAFQRKQQKTIQHELLKYIFMPQRQHLAEILSKLQILSQQYRYNIRSRKVYDLNVLKKPIIRAQQKQFNNQKNQQVSNLVLKKIESPKMNKKAKSVTTFRVKQKSNPHTKKQKIVIQFNKKQSPLRKKLISMPGTVQKTVIDLQKDSPLKNSVILQKNENSIKNHGIDMNLLNILKSQVIKKVKEDFNIGLNPKSHENQALEVFIDTKVKQTMKSIFPFQPQKQVKPPIEFTHVQIKQANLNTQIQNMFKHSIPEYRQMQYNSIDLIKIIQNSPYVYMINASLGHQKIGQIICSLDKEIHEFKVLKILYIHFIDLSELQFLILEVTKYLWKFQNSYQVHFMLFQPTNNDTIKLLIQGIENTLEKQCIVGRKQLYSTVMQVKLIFKRPSKNVNYIPNHRPFSFHLEFRLLFSQKKLMLQNRNQHKHLQLLNYDYFLMQAIKRFLTPQDILVLKQKINWRNRLKYLLDLIRQQQENDLMTDIIVQIVANNISQLNNYLTKQHQAFLEASDIVKTNNLSMLCYQVTLTPNFSMKSVYRGNHEQFFRFSIKQKTVVKIDEEGTCYYFLQAKQTLEYQLVLFNARHYHSKSKEEDTWLSLYLSERLNKNQHGMRTIQKFIQNLWVPMCRFPHKFKDREEMFYHTMRVLDLVHLKTDVLLGEKMQFFCNMEMENSIKYQDHDSDVIIQNPFGVAVLAVPSNTVIYTRIFL